MGQMCVLVVVLFCLLASLACILTALLTDNWYKVWTEDNVNPDVKKSYNFHYGLWRLCYADMPTVIANDPSYNKEGSCIYIHEKLIQKHEDKLNYDSKIRLHLSRTVLGCSIAAAALLFGALVSIMCGMWPGNCDHIRKHRMYFSASLVILLGTMCGIASGIAFIAIRDLDNETFRTYIVTPPAVPAYASQEYDWSFMLHWIGTGLAFLDSFILLCLMKNSYDSVNGDPKFSSF